MRWLILILILGGCGSSSDSNRDTKDRDTAQLAPPIGPLEVWPDEGIDQSHLELAVHRINEISGVECVIAMNQPWPETLAESELPPPGVMVMRAGECRDTLACVRWDGWRENGAISTIGPHIQAQASAMGHELLHVLLNVTDDHHWHWGIFSPQVSQGDWGLPWQLHEVLRHNCLVRAGEIESEMTDLPVSPVVASWTE